MYRFAYAAAQSASSITRESQVCCCAWLICDCFLKIAFEQTKVPTFFCAKNLIAVHFEIELLIKEKHHE